MRDLAKENREYREANPWRMVNLQSSQSLCGRYATLEEATAEAERRGGLVAVDGHDVLFSEMPCL